MLLNLIYSAWLLTSIKQAASKTEDGSNVFLKNDG
jgi:hypothetical protein